MQPPSYDLKTAATLARLGLLLSLLLATQVVYACSGPDAAQTIRKNESLGLILMALSLASAGLLFVYMRRISMGMRSRKFWPLYMLVVLHPGCWMSARSGDCGRMLVLSSVLVTCAVVALCSFLYFQAYRQRKALSKEPERP